MPSISKFAGSIRDRFADSFSAVRERWRVLTITVLFICAPVYAMAWWLDVHDNLAVSIAITGLVTTMPAIRFFSQPEALTFRSYEVWLSVLCSITLALLIGERYDIRFLSFSVILVLLTLPYALVLWLILRHEWLLYTGVALALVAAMVYWTAASVINGAGFDLLLLPMPVIIAGGVLWAPAASWTLNCARRHKKQRISGPGMRALAMTMLFLPVTLVAIALPTDLGLGSTWPSVSLALIGIFLSGVISEPLRCFLIEWGKLSPNEK